MRKTLFKLLSVFMVCLIAVSFTLTAFADEPINESSVPNYDDLVQPCYDNLNSVTTSFSVIDGRGYIAVTYYAYTDTFTYAKLYVKLQKQILGLFWQTVDISDPNDQWTGVCYEAQGGTFDPSFYVGGPGTYRVILKLEVYGTDGTVDVVNDTIKSSNST